MGAAGSGIVEYPGGRVPPPDVITAEYENLTGDTSYYVEAAGYYD